LGDKIRTFFLFNDLLLYARATSGKRNTLIPGVMEANFQYKGEIPLVSSWIRNLPNTKLLKNGSFFSIILKFDI